MGILIYIATASLVFGMVGCGQDSMIPDSQPTVVSSTPTIMPTPGVPFVANDLQISSSPSFRASISTMQSPWLSPASGTLFHIRADVTQFRLVTKP